MTEEEEDKRLMEHFDIAVERKEVFIFQGHRYTRLKDAVKYAKILAEQQAAPPQEAD